MALQLRPPAMPAPPLQGPGTDLISHMYLHYSIRLSFALMAVSCLCPAKLQFYCMGPVRACGSPRARTHTHARTRVHTHAQTHAQAHMGRALALPTHFGRNLVRVLSCIFVGTSLLHLNPSLKHIGWVYAGPLPIPDVAPGPDVPVRNPLIGMFMLMFGFRLHAIQHHG